MITTNKTDTIRKLAAAEKAVRYEIAAEEEAARQAHVAALEVPQRQYLNNRLDQIFGPDVLECGKYLGCQSHVVSFRINSDVPPNSNDIVWFEIDVDGVTVAVTTVTALPEARLESARPSPELGLVAALNGRPDRTVGMSLATAPAPTFTVDTETVLETDKPKSAHIIDRGDSEQTAEFLVLEARVNKTPLSALCGYTWIPSENPKTLPVCSKCLEMFEFAKSFRGIE
jgi:Protein of unknown function (DUF3039)